MTSRFTDVDSIAAIAVFPNGSPFRILSPQRRLFGQIGLLLVTFLEKRSPKNYFSHEILFLCAIFQNTCKRIPFWFFPCYSFSMTCLPSDKFQKGNIQRGLQRISDNFGSQSRLRGDFRPRVGLWILEYFRAVKLKIFLNHGESIPQQSLKIHRSGVFQSSKTRNFLQPW